MNASASLRPRRRFAGRFVLPALVAALALLAPRARAADFAFGADISSARDLESRGLQLKDTDGKVKPEMEILQNHGYNWVRIRTCVPEARLPQTAEYTIAMFQDAKKRGLKTLLDLHYSNAWADPTNEPTPAAWRDMTHEQRVKALFDYTSETITQMRLAGAMPDVIQVGNEIGNGMLWPDGKLPDHWDNFLDYLRAGINGIDAGRGNLPRPKIMIHVDHGGNVAKTKYFFDHLKAAGIPFDIIGISFYPWSHGTLVDLRDNLYFMATTYHKPIILVETGYYYTESRYFREIPGPFPETPEGQKEWLEAVTDIVLQTPEQLGKGVFWWEPAGGRGLTQRGYWDNEGNPQPVLDAFRKFAMPPHRTDGQDDGDWFLK
jgi:arabinogalactan endo-1,4-beta-galactosidase